MVKLGISNKHQQIDKANTLVVILVSFAAFIVTFSLFASKAMLDQRTYQNKIIKEKTVAHEQLKKNIQAAGPLAESYKKFVDEPTNVIGGIATGTGNQDGDNAKIVLDALPSKYDFPAVATSLEKLLKANSFNLVSIMGTDDELNQQATTAQGLVEIPFEATVSGSYAGTKEAVSLFERSIRPFQIDTLSYSGGDNDMTLKVLGRTFYQPEKSLKITTKDVK